MNGRQKLWSTSRALGWSMNKAGDYERGSTRIEVKYTPTGLVKSAKLYQDGTEVEYVPDERLPGKLEAVLEWMKQPAEVTQ
jgi:hypothetical protein